ncbi:MAG: GNAT family N-acetyltransferase [Acidobacteriia bacterium]|nr:GNAT family N-acetyltransferase [Terriglobia bacterium]
MNDWLFYMITVPADRAVPTLPEGYTCETWCPAPLRFVPNGLPFFPFAVWWLFHMLHIFANRGYAVFIIRYGGKLIHRSVITPRYFRFPFMTEADLQVGDTWTDPAERGKRLATIALESIIRMHATGECTCWYVVEPHNRASIRVVEKAGFTFVGSGIRMRRLGLGILGRFLLTRRVGPEQTERTATEAW